MLRTRISPLAAICYMYFTASAIPNAKPKFSVFDITGEEIQWSLI